MESKGSQIQKVDLNNVSVVPASLQLTLKNLNCICLIIAKIILLLALSTELELGFWFEIKCALIKAKIVDPFMCVLQTLVV